MFCDLYRILNFISSLGQDDTQPSAVKHPEFDSLKPVSLFYLHMLAILTDFIMNLLLFTKVIKSYYNQVARNIITGNDRTVKVTDQSCEKCGLSSHCPIRMLEYQIQ